MRWSAKAVNGWIENYYPLRDYELNPFETRGVFKGEEFSRGSSLHYTPMEELFDMNWEFDKAIKSLGELGSKVFRLRYLEGYKLDEVKLDYPDKEIKTHWRACKRRLIKYLLESEK